MCVVRVSGLLSTLYCVCVCVCVVCGRMGGDGMSDHKWACR
jgi:hypothetical protein